MMSPYSRFAHSHNERGAYLPIIGAILFALILLSGYAVDAGTLYTAQVDAQKAADTGALAGAAYLSLNGGDFTESNPVVDNEAQRLALETTKENLRQRGYSEQAILSLLSDVIIHRVRNAAEPIRSKLSVEVKARVEAPFVVLRYVPGFDLSGRVIAVAESDVKPAIIALILDNSGSMACPNVEPGQPLPNCNCFPNCPNKKIEYLKRSVVDNFLTRFDAVRDIITVTTFNTKADQLVGPALTGGFDRAAVSQRIFAIAESGATNMTDAFDQAYELTRPAATRYPDLLVIYVLFTDGAPTAVKLAFANPGIALPANPATTNTYSYYAWAVDWTVPPSTQPLDGVSRLSPSPLPLSACNEYECPENLAAGYAGSPPCSSISFNNGNVEDAQTELGGAGCLTDLKFRDRDGTVWPTIDAPIASFRERFMDSAIAEADWMRKNGGIWFAIGLGLPPEGDLPFGNPRNDFTRKDNFLRRIVLSPTGGVDFPGYPTFNELLSQYKDHTPGEYYPTPTASELPALFDAVGQRIRLRLIK